MVVLLTAYIHEANIPDLVRHWRAAAAITPCRLCRCHKRLSFGTSCDAEKVWNEPTLPSFSFTANARIAPLRINITAGAAACDRMGLVRAAIRVTLLDANRDHPTAPVLNPGGALRGMIKAHYWSKLNLIDSLIGLHRWRGL